MRFKWSPEENHCFGCGENPYGLGLDFSEDGEWAVAKTRLDENYQGFQHIAHGGIVAVLLDEAAGWAIMLKEDIVAPSYDLHVEIRKPVPLEKELLIKGRILDSRHTIFTTKAQVLKDGDILAQGTIKSKQI